MLWIILGILVIVIAFIPVMYKKVLAIEAERKDEQEIKILRTKYDELVKSHFASDIEQFWRKIQVEPGVKNCKLFEGVSTSSCNLAK